MFKVNAIYCGDCEDVLKKFPDKSIDLVYGDPPFFTQKNYEIIWGDGYEVRAFEDRWKGGKRGIYTYIEWMRPKIEQIHRVLKDTGSFYLHCDWHASHYLKVLCDEVFGYNNFQNEIVWHYGLGGSSPRRYARKHDIILFYTKGRRWTFNPPMKPATVWNIPSINNMAKERLGYPTQKPEKLLDVIIKASSNPTDIVLDPFCGCGTAIAVAHKLGRRWIGIDISPTACKLMVKRMRSIGVKISESDIIGLPMTVEELKSVTPHDFQNWVCQKLSARVSPRRSGDMGIDGWIMNTIPIQVKQSERVGRNVVDNFETALRRAKKKEGIIVAFSFTSGAYSEASRAKIQEGLNIKLITVEELLNNGKEVLR